jgi:hypothetical protein
MVRTRHVAVVLCLATSLVSFFVRHDPEVYIPYATNIPLFFFLPYLLYRGSATVRRRVTSEWSSRVERVGLAILLLNIPGVLLLHEFLPELQFDRLLHFGAAAVGVQGMLLLLMPWSPHSTKRDLLGHACIISFLFLFAWEGYQYIQDTLFGTHSFFDYAQPLWRDFWEDVFFGMLGVVVGVIHAAMVYRRTARVRITA